MDTHTDTCCVGANWNLMHYTDEVFEVYPFWNKYNLVQEIPVSRCCTVWTDDEGKKYLILVTKCYGLEQH